MSHRTRTAWTALFISACGALLVSASGCASSSLAAPELAPMAIEQPATERNAFARDRTGGISEQDLQTLLAAPVFLEEDARLGLVPVTVAYEADATLPLAVVPQRLGEALEGTGFFEVATELSADWPKDLSIAGLRELAARYRTRYLLLYRHRFAEQDYTNGWGWSYLTLVAIPFVPSQTWEAAGVLEATLFDAQTGAVLFTVFERVHGVDDFNVWGNERKAAELRARLLDEAVEGLSRQAVAKVHRLVAARPQNADPQRVAASTP